MTFSLGVVSSTFQIVQILALEATEWVSELVTQTVIELIISTAKEMSVKATFFFMLKPQQTDFEMMLK